MGSRKRFLFRLIVYPLLPLLGLYVIWSRWGDSQAALLGVLALIMGLTAVYLYFGRLRRPRAAVRYALNPLGSVRRLLSPATRANFADLEQALRAAIPDVSIQPVALPQSEVTCLRLGEELLLCLGVHLSKPEEVEVLAAALQEAQTPLHRETLLLVLQEPTERALLAQLRVRLPRLSLLMSS